MPEIKPPLPPIGNPHGEAAAFQAEVSEAATTQKDVLVNAEKRDADSIQQISSKKATDAGMANYFVTTHCHI